MFLHYGDLSDSTNLFHIVSSVRPHEIYNLGAMSHVQVSFEMPEYTAEVDGVGTLRLLNAIRSCGLTKFTRFYQASTSELYGKVREIPQTGTKVAFSCSTSTLGELSAIYSRPNGIL